MKKLSLLGIVFGAALLAAAPVSIQPSPKSVVGLYVDKAEALVGPYGRVHRRHYRRAYRRSTYYGGYGYGVGSSYYGYGYPGYAYPGYSGYYGYGYPVAVAPLGINWGNWGGWPW
jgi:hypothetical protein